METHDKRLAGQLYAVGSLNGILSRLEHVRKSGDGYRAKCPAHDGEGKGTLSISESKIVKGKILLHCWGEECAKSEIMASIGMEMSDLFPERLTHHAPPEQRRKWRQDAIHRDWCDFLNIAAYEMNIIYVAGGVIRAGNPLSDEHNIRLDDALKRIRQIGEMFNGNV
jgi:hypothetical protein